ncbi:YMGG-like glycine zipper-containing protein [Rubellimicrobium arenae]|uniref:YMGG-like glycine zipper-containing protein n=1 Tax=Rubellimicrobium arenae TaxID=2817372 RepID=UPI001B300869|nr:YMGG-like glycine zipper-containing protein [Rubellimicrobium arenae]
MALTLRMLGVLGLAATLAACGETDLERTATGAAIGAGIATVTGESAVNGALIGAAAGAVSCSVAPGAPNCY